MRARSLRIMLALAAFAAFFDGPGLVARQNAPAQEPEAAVEEGPFDRLHFRNIGPATPSGRVDDFAVLESDPSVFYVAGATSGVWKTVNNGTTFTPVFAHQGSSSIGDIAIAQTDANLVWVGTGENNNRQSSSWGDGVYKSTDGGKTWENMGLRDSRQIARVLIDPVDYSVVYVAALGDLWSEGGERGVYKTTDGGLTWERTLFVDDDTGATELVMDPSNNRVLYAATYQRRRQQWGMNGGGVGSAIWKSTDAGETWTKLENGIPEGPKGRIQMDIWLADPDVLYARVEHPREGGIYRTDDAGASWRKMSDLNPRPMYFSQIRIDPKTDSRIYVLGVQLHISDDGGKTFRSDGGENIHVDHHAMWIDPNNPDHIIVGNDGGVSISYDRSATWVWLPNLPFAQYYHVSYDMQTPYDVCGGLQDNYTWCGPSAVRTESGITNEDWYTVHGGDGFVGLIDPSNPRIAYAESQNGRMSRVDRLTAERQSIRPEPADGDPDLRWNWDTAMMLSPHDPATIYVGANRLYRSKDRGHTWEAISPDLTTNTDRSTLSIMRVEDAEIEVAKHDGVTDFGNIVTMAESTLTPGVLWTGTDDGVVSLSRDAGASWTNVTPDIPGVPKWTYVSKVEPSRHDDETVYVTFDGHRGGDYETYVFASTDLGGSWRSISGNLPDGEVVRTLTEDIRNPDVLYLGTETGLWVSLDRGGAWTRVTGNLPTVPIYEIALHPRDNDMILATHGRALWILDDLTPFQQWTESEGEDFAFEPPPAVAFNAADNQNKGFQGDRQFLGANPELGAALAYRLDAEAAEVTWTIRDGQNQVIREIAGDAMEEHTHAGYNLVYWDLRVQPLERLSTQEDGGGGGGGGGGGTRGPLVLPATYQATLSVDGSDAATVSITVTGDRDIEISDADRKVWHDTAMTLHTMQGQATEAAEAIIDAWSQHELIEGQLEDQEVPDNLQQQVEALGKELEGLRRRLGLSEDDNGGGGDDENVRGQIGRVKNQIMGATALPTATQMRIVKELQADLPTLVNDANTATAKIAPLMKELMSEGVLPAPIERVGGSR